MCRLKSIWQHSYLFLNFFAPISLQAAGLNIQLAEALSAGASTNTTQVNALNPYLLVIQHCSPTFIIMFLMHFFCLHFRLSASSSRFSASPPHP